MSSTRPFDLPTFSLKWCRPWWRALAWLLLAASALEPLGAQRPIGDGTVVEQFTVEDGLPVNAITELVQSRDGYLWFGTFDGLVRFDGARFTVYSIANTPGLPTNRILTVREARDGGLWLITEQRALVHFFRGRATPVAVPSRIQLPYEDRAGTLWLSLDDGLGMVRNGAFTRVAAALVREPVEAMVQRADGSLWVAYARGRLARVVNGRAEPLPDQPAIVNALVQAMYEDPDGVLWITTARGIVRWARTPELLVADSTRIPLAPVSPLSVVRGHDGTLWTSTWTGLWRIAPGVPQRAYTWKSGLLLYPQLVALPDSSVIAIPGGDALVARPPTENTPGSTRLISRAGTIFGSATVDRDGTLWLGTIASGVLHLKRTPISMMPLPAASPPPIVYPVLTTRDGAVWYGTNQGQLRRFDPVTGTTADRLGAVLQDTSVMWWVRTMLEDRAGHLWVGGTGFLARCDDHASASMRCARVGSASGDVPLRLDQGVLALHETRDGAIWVGTGHGLYRRAPAGTWERFNGSGAPASGARAFVETPDGALWMGTVADGLVRWRDGQFRSVRVSDGLPADLVRALHVDDAGMLWVGTEGRGLAHLDPRAWAPGQRGRIVTIDTRHGLFDDVLHTILPDNAGRLWFNTNRGIFHVAKRELDDFAAGRVSRVNAVSYTERDGLANREGNGGSQPAAARTADGRLWFPTQQGVGIVDPSRVVRVAVPPLVVIEALRAGDTTVVGGDTLVTPGLGRRDLEIDYTAPNFVAPRALRFRYRLEPYDTAWVDAGARRTAFYTRVPPGRYTFRVLAGTDDGRWSERPAAMAIDIAPRWWETPLARWFAVLAIALSIAGGVQWRLRLLRRRATELEAVVSERTGALREREQQLATRNEQLADLVEARSRLFANLSHEFRTPLTLILGPLRSLLDGRHGTLGPTVREQGELMERNGQRLLRLINQVLDLSRLQAGAVSLDRSPRDLDAFVRATALAFTPLAERRRIALAVEGASLPVVVSFDAEQLEKVLLNLLSNAFKFTDPGGRVAVSVTRDDHVAVVTVRDTGIGIAPDVLPRVFDRFWQADASATRKHEGTGIGLALAKELVELHGGTISAESMVGQGSTFTVHLPLVHDAAVVAAVAAALPTSRHTTPVPIDEVTTTADHAAADANDPEDRTTVLLVDDNADVRAFVRSLLAARYRVLEAPDGKAGLELARLALPDLIVADVMMPELDGLGLGRALRDDPMTDAIPLILLTARADTADQVAGLGTGADAYLTKPFDAPVLEATIGSLLAQRRRLRERFAVRAEASDSIPPGAPNVGRGDPADGSAMPNGDAMVAAPSALELRLRPLVEARLTDPAFDHAALAEAAGLSYNQLYRGLRDASGESPSRFIRRVRVERAAALLAAREGSVSEVAYSVGFESLSYFSRAFTERFGVPPSAVLRGEAAAQRDG